MEKIILFKIEIVQNLNDENIFDKNLVSHFIQSYS